MATPVTILSTYLQANCHNQMFVVYNPTHLFSYAHPHTCQAFMNTTVIIINACMLMITTKYLSYIISHIFFYPLHNLIHGSTISTTQGKVSMNTLLHLSYTHMSLSIIKGIHTPALLFINLIPATLVPTTHLPSFKQHLSLY